MDTMGFGLQVRTLRKSRGLTQSQLAEQLGVSVEYVGKIERGVSTPSFALIGRLAQALEADPSDLFCSAPADSPTRRRQPRQAGRQNAGEVSGELSHGQPSGSGRPAVPAGAAGSATPLLHAGFRKEPPTQDAAGARTPSAPPWSKAWTDPEPRAVTEMCETLHQGEDMLRLFLHDLKAPLAGLLHAPALMRAEGGLNRAHLNVLQTVEDTVQVLLEQIDRYSDLFLLEQGAYRMEPEPFDLLALARRVAAVLDPLASQKGLFLLFFLNSSPARETDRFLVQGDASLCYSLLAHLLTNAIEASPDGERVTIRLLEDPGRRMLALSNQGVAPPHIRSRFFEKYTSHGKPRGLGLGTYTARLIAQAHGWDIRLETDNVSTTILVNLPS